MALAARLHDEGKHARGTTVAGHLGAVQVVVRRGLVLDGRRGLRRRDRRRAAVGMGGLGLVSVRGGLRQRLGLGLVHLWGRLGLVNLCGRLGLVHRGRLLLGLGPGLRLVRLGGRQLDLLLAALLLELCLLLQELLPLPVE